MLKNLNTDQIIAVAMISFVYHHKDPMEVLLAPLLDCGQSKVLLWVNEVTGEISTQPFARSSILLKEESKQNTLIGLPIAYIPVSNITKGLDVSDDGARLHIASSALNHFIHFCWSNISIKETTITTKTVDLLFNDLSCPLSGVGEMVLDNVIMPSLTEGFNPKSSLH